MNSFSALLNEDVFVNADCYNVQVKFQSANVKKLLHRFFAKYPKYCKRRLNHKIQSLNLQIHFFGIEQRFLLWLERSIKWERNQLSIWIWRYLLSLESILKNFWSIGMEDCWRDDNLLLNKYGWWKTFDCLHQTMLCNLFNQAIKKMIIKKVRAKKVAKPWSRNLNSCNRQLKAFSL